MVHQEVPETRATVAQVCNLLLSGGINDYERWIQKDKVDTSWVPPPQPVPLSSVTEGKLYCPSLI